MSNVAISDAEWQVMQVVWGRGKATAAEVIEELSLETSWSHRTIRTLLARLVEKGVLETAADGNRYIYKPLITRQKCIRSESRSFLQRVFGGNSAELLVHFARDAQITPEEIEALKKILDAKRTSDT